MSTCPNCGAEMRPEHDLCSECGHSLSGNHRAPFPERSEGVRTLLLFVGCLGGIGVFAGSCALAIGFHHAPSPPGVNAALDLGLMVAGGALALTFSLWLFIRAGRK